jgi:phage terminase large subunit
VAEIFSQHGLSLTKATNDRVAGWLDMKEWLQPVVDEEGNTSSNLKIFRNCTNLIESIPALQFDPKNPSDCANEPHQFTHGPDAIRYYLAGRPRPTNRPAPKHVFNFKAEMPKPDPSGRGEKVRVI